MTNTERVKERAAAGLCMHSSLQVRPGVRGGGGGGGGGGGKGGKKGRGGMTSHKGGRGEGGGFGEGGGCFGGCRAWATVALEWEGKG